MNTLSLPLSRLLAHVADAVRAVRSGQSLNDALAACPDAARPGTQALSFQVLRSLGRAEALRRQLVPKAPPPWVDALVLSALALAWRADEAPYPEHTLVDQAVEAAKQRERARAAFVNAVLRRFLRERDALVAATDTDPVARWNHPRWWIDRLRRDWPDDWQQVLLAANQRPPMTLRVNARHATPQACVERLQAEGVAARGVGPYGVQLAEPRPVQAIPGFSAGVVSVQDLAAQWAAPLLLGTGLPPGARVLDACAAPGGKTAHLLELADLDVLALDSDPARLARIGDTLGRLHLTARCVAADARQPQAYWDGRPFDAILMDAPCSASGIVSRHPDVRWLRRDSDIGRLATIQREMLDALWALLKPGGRLVYCTCSVFKAEGQQQIDAFLQRQSDARSLPAPGHALPVPDNQTAARDEGVGTAAPPPAHDGFFYALLEKTLT